MSLRDLAKRVGVSPSLISQIETGKARPSVATLYALTSALHISLDRLFAEPSSDPGADGPAPILDLAQVSAFVVRAGERKVIELESGVRWERLTAASHPGVDFLDVYYEVGGASSDTMIRHSGREFGIVLSGVLTVTVNFDDYLLSPGDSICFPATTPHRLWNSGAEPARLVWCVVGRHRPSGPLT